MASSSLGQSTPRRGSTYRRAPLLLLITRRRLERGDRRERGPGPELQDDADGDKRGERRPLTFSACCCCCCCCISASMIIRFSLVVLVFWLVSSSPPLAVHLSAASSSDESIWAALPFDCSRRRRSRSSSSLLSTTATMLMSFSFSSSSAAATLFGGFALAAVIRLISERQSFRPPVLSSYCWTTKFGCSFAAS